MRRWTRTLLALSAIGLVTCSSDATGTAAVRTLLVEPSERSMEVGEQLALRVTATGANGEAVSTSGIFWSSSDESIARVTAGGSVTALAPGNVRIAASTDGRSATSRISVQQRAVREVRLSPLAAQLTINETQRFTASLRGSDGGLITGRDIAWSIDDASIASVDATGLVRALRTGTTIVRATSEGRVGEAQVIVATNPVARVAISPTSASLQVNTTQQFAATAYDSQDRVLTGRLITWSIAPSTVASVSASGLVRGLTAGTAVLVADVEGRQATAVVSVAASAVSSVTVTPATGTIATNATIRLTATVRLADGSTQANPAVSWSTSNADVAIVASDGLVRGIGAGVATITASSGTRNGTSRITVTAGAASVARVALTPSGATLQVNDTQAFTATAYDSDNRVLTGRSVSWSISPTSVATVNGSGLVRAIGPGAAVLTAEIDGRQATALVNVAASAVSSVTVTPATGTIAINATIRLTATVRLADGSTQADPTVSWSTSNTDVAIVASDGLVRGVGAGVATITASSGTRSGTSRITVTAGAASVARVALTPSGATLQVNDTQAFTATAYDSDNRVLTGRSVSWSISPTSVATVNGSGLVRAVGPGAAVVTAEIDGRQATALVNVAVASVASVTVAPRTATIAPNGTVALSATVRLSDGTTPTNPAVSWSTSNSDVAIVGSDGLVRGVAAGTATITATSGTRTDAATITVVAPAAVVARVALTPTSASLPVDDTQQFTATVYDSDDRVITGRSVSWSVSDTRVATVNGTGLVTAKSPGSAVLTAEVDGRQATAPLTVSAIPVGSVTVAPNSSTLAASETVRIIATVRLVNGTVVVNPSITWSSSNTAVATVDDAGLVLAVGPGSASVTATSGGQSDAAAITVTAPPAPSVTALQVTPLTATVQVGSTQQYTVTARTTDGTVLPTPDITWSATPGTVASVSSTGLVTGSAVGIAIITASTAAGVSGGAGVVVIPASTPPSPNPDPDPTPGKAGVTITLPNGSAAANVEIDVGESIQLGTVVRNPAGKVITPSVSWSSNAATVASVSSSGLVLGRRAGSAQITARAAGRTTTLLVEVDG